MHCGRWGDRRMLGQINWSRRISMPTADFAFHLQGWLLLRGIEKSHYSSCFSPAQTLCWTKTRRITRFFECPHCTFCHGLCILMTGISLHTQSKSGPTATEGLLFCSNIVTISMPTADVAFHLYG